MFKQESKAILPIGLSVLFAICASVSSAAGIFVWPVLMLIVVKLDIHIKIRTILIFGFLLLFLVTAYICNYVTFLSSTSLNSTVISLSSIFDILYFMLSILGLPWSAVSSIHHIATILGGLILAAAMYCLVINCFKNHHLTRLEIAATAMLLFSLLAIAVIAYYRYKLFSIESGHGHRYGIYTMIATISLIIIFIPTLTKWLDNTKFKVSISMVLIGFGLISLVQQVIVGEFAVNRAAKYREVAKQVLDNDIDADLFQKLSFFHKRNRAVHMYHLLSNKRLYVQHITYSN